MRKTSIRNKRIPIFVLVMALMLSLSMNTMAGAAQAAANPVPQDPPMVADSHAPTSSTPAVEQNATEGGKDCLVTFDPNDGEMGYNNFFKVTVPPGGKVTSKPADPVRDGYFFKGWYVGEDVNDNPIFWDFESDTVQENTTLWAAWEKGYLVAFDPDDGKTGYNGFFKVTVPIGGKVTSKPADPVRDGYFFKGWYVGEDMNDNPIFWNFDSDTVQENTTLWAAWEKGCLVAFDPDDGKTGYNDFFKVTVPIGGKVTSKPADPVRDGYLFKGWYAVEDLNDNPVFWNFESDTVQENATLWAAWEKGCIVAFDLGDGKTEYSDFFKTTVPISGKVTDKSADPIRDGYLFKGWYAFEDENGNPVFWNFETDTVQDNTTLWAAWEIKSDGGGNTGSGNIGGGGTGSGNTGSSNTGSGNTGSSNTGSSNTGGSNTGSSNTGSSNTGSNNTGSNNTGSGNTGGSNAGGGSNANNGSNINPGWNVDTMPKTGAPSNVFWWTMLVPSVMTIGIQTIFRKKRNGT